MNDRGEDKLTNFLTRQAILEKPEHAAAVASIPVLGEVVGEWSGVVALMTKRALIFRDEVGPRRPLRL